jgi:hypothetical protein
LGVFERAEGLMQEFAHHSTDDGHFGFAPLREALGKGLQDGVAAHDRFNGLNACKTVRFMSLARRLSDWDIRSQRGFTLLSANSFE